jgi:putative flavoprotein involved in K+ transport
MKDRFETVVIGGGQAGLALSHYLTSFGRNHIVLEAGRIGESWRSQRWDSFRLNTPNFMLQLPGYPYEGDDPEGFLTREETLAYVEGYAAAVAAPVRTGVRVSSLRTRGRGGFVMETPEGPIGADNVAVATGSFSRPAPRPPVGELPPEIVELHASAYANSGELPAGATLVVGSGQSGCQIAADLRRAGRNVYLSLGRCPCLPLYYRGRQLGAWMIDLGAMDETVESLPSPSARLACNPAVTSDETPHHCGPLRLAREGVLLLGRVEAIEGTRVSIRPDLNESLSASDEADARFRRRVDEYVESARVDIQEEAGGVVPSPTFAEARELDLHAAGVTSIVWANGYRPDFGWIELPIFDHDGWPIQVRGVTVIDGLYFVGLHWLHKRKSGLLIGVGEDAEFVVSKIVAG